MRNPTAPAESKTAFMLATIVFLLTISGHANPSVSDPGGSWQQYATPAEAGFDAEQLTTAYAIADEIGSGAVFVVRGDHVVTAWGDVTRRFKCHSVRKSFLSALYGAAVRDGAIDLNTSVGLLGIDGSERLNETERTATVEQLLQSRSGIYLPAAKEPRSMKKSRPERGSQAPGERFWYNNWDFNTAGHIYELGTGRGIFTAFLEDIAQPIGMEDFRIEDTVYQFERKSSPVPAYAFRMSARDAARFGLLYKNRGTWDGHSLIPADWIDRSWQVHSRLDEHEGYGYMWWIYEPGSNAVRPDLSAYAARGTGGQLIAIIPEADLVIVHRADTDFGGGANGGEVWRLVRAIADATVGSVASSPKLTAVKDRPFSTSLPELRLPETVSIEIEVLDRYVGDYQINPELTVSLTRVDDVLVGFMPGQGEADFFAVSSTEFYAKAVGATLEFVLDDHGDVKKVVLQLRGQVMEATRVSSGSDSPSGL